MTPQIATLEFGLLIGGQWLNTPDTIEVRHKYSGHVVGRVARCTRSDVDAAVDAAHHALHHVKFPPYRRYEVLLETARLMGAERELLARTLTAEVGKTIKEAYGEVDRAIQTMIISAEEAKRIGGEVVPVAAAPGSENRIAFTMRVPIGVIGAITPFNVPLNLVCHKVGPALAGGNAVVLKPATTTPLVAAILCRLLQQAGLPPGYINLLTGSGRDVGNWLVQNQKVSMYTFTGSPQTGEWLKANSGLRKVSLELGNNAANIVCADADIALAADLCARRGFANAGQVCISVQRILVQRAVLEPFRQAIKAVTESLIVGDPEDPATDVGPMISEAEAIRTEQWVQEALAAGARVVAGGHREGPVYFPTVLEQVTNEMKVCCQEVFAPVVSLMPFDTIDEAIALANDSDYGLQAGVFTSNLDLAMRFARELEVGGVIINDTSAYRVDQMPYGGVKASGIGREGPRYAIEEMTEPRLIVMNLKA